MKWSSSRAKQRNIIINIIKGTSVARASLPEQLSVYIAPTELSVKSIPVIACPIRVEAIFQLRKKYSQTNTHSMGII